MAIGISGKNFSFLGIGRLVSLSIQALFYLVFAAILDPELYGKLNVILALAGTFSTISRFGLNYTLQVYQSRKESDLAEQVKTLFVILTGVAALFLLVIDVFASLLCIGMSFFLMHQQNLLGLKKYKNFMLNSIIRGILFFILPLSLFFILEIPGIVLGMAIASILPSIPFFKDFKIKTFFELKNRLKFLIQNYLIEISGLAVFIDKLLISNLFGFIIVGIYQFNLQILMAIQILPGILFHYLITEEASGESHRKISSLVIISSFIITLPIIVLSPLLVNEFFPKYSEGILSLQIIVFTIIPQSIGTIFTAKLIARESTTVGFAFIANIVTLLLLMMTLGNLYGLIGLSISVLLATSLQTGMSFYLYRKMQNQTYS